MIFIGGIIGAVAFLVYVDIVVLEHVREVEITLLHRFERIISVSYTHLYNHAVVIISLVKFESAEINPCAATYFLIYLKFCNSTVMENEVLGIAYTIRQCLIRNVNGIFACCRQGRYPFGKYLVLILLFLSFGGDKTASSIAERIFPIPINRFL